MTVRPGKKFGFQSAAENCNDGDDRTDSGRLFQTDAAVAGKVRMLHIVSAVVESGAL